MIDPIIDAATYPSLPSWWRLLLGLWRQFLPILALALVGCEVQRPAHLNWIREYQCSADQLPAMEREFNVCRQTQYDNGYCYGIAKRSHCTRRPEP
jgi:hypothetical protein